jgi:hypothetical protein
MGADLIVFIAKGPQKFSKRSLMRAARHAKQLRKKANKLYEMTEELEALSEGSRERADLALKIDKFFTNQAFSGIRCQTGLDGVDALKDAGYLVEMASEIIIEKLVSDFSEWWESCNAPDTSSRTDPDDKRRKIVVCGELSWGDSPDGYGYKLMDKAYWFEIPEMLGVR